MKKVLDTGIEITYDKKGCIKSLYSPYYSKKENNPVRGGLLNYLHYRLCKLISK